MRRERERGGGVDDRGTQGEKRPPSLWVLRDEVGEEACSTEVFRRISIDDLVSFSAPTDGVAEEERAEVRARRSRSARRPRSVERTSLEETPDPVNIAVARSDGIEDCCFSLGRID